MRTLQPPGWARPSGYANGVVATGAQVFVAGMIGWDDNQHFHSDTLVDQVEQALRNVLAVLAEADATAADITRMTWYITSRADYLAQVSEIGTVYRDVIGRNFPAMSVVEVTALMEERAQVEIEVTAVIQENEDA